MKSKPDRKPDIAFWFDEKDPTLYIIRIREGIMNIHLVQAAFDLLSRAIKQELEGKTLIGEMEDEE